MNNRVFVLVLIVMVNLILTTVVAQNSLIDSNRIYTNRLRMLGSIDPAQEDESLVKCKQIYRFFELQKDTLKMCTCLYRKAEIYRHLGLYANAFDELWEALYLAKAIGFTSMETRLHRVLADLYDIYAMNESSLFHRQSALVAAKKALAEDGKNLEHVVSAFMNLAIRERKLGNYASALNYLDSCVVYHVKSDSSDLPYPFLDAEKGYIMFKLGRPLEAFQYLLKSKKETEGTKISYRWNINFYLGELKLQLGDVDSAIYYYNKSLGVFDNQSRNYILKSDILLRLSQIYKQKGQIRRAYDYLQQSSDVKDSLFYMQRSTQGELFQIRDSYYESLKRKNEQLNRQKLEIEQNRRVQSRMTIILGLLMLLVIGFILIVRLRLKYRRTLHEKKEAALQAQLNEERIQSNLEVKSKELTSYALQLIDKDGAIDELLSVIEKDSPSVFKPLKTKYKKGSSDLWNEFNLRFTEVNSDFYQRLKVKHPKLSQTELKHCALIKLNFSTKEMARILSIEAHSVHISRSRIRKKIGLQRGDSLEEYIMSL